MDRARIERVRGQARRELVELTLRQLREEAGKTQNDVADLLHTTQSALSKLERRESSPLEPLRAYIAALGGELEVVAVMRGRRVRLLGL